MVGQDCRVRLALCTPLIIHHVHLMQVSLTLALHISCVRSMTPVCIVLQGLWPTIFDRGGSQPGSNIARCRPSGILYLQLDVYSARCKLSLTKMFFGAATDTQCAAFLTTPRFADPDSVSRGQQCRLLQLGPSRCVWPSSRPAAVSSQRRRSTDLLGEEVRTHNPSALRTPLVASSREDTIPIVCSGVSLSSRHCAIIPRRDASPNHRR